MSDMKSPLGKRDREVDPQSESGKSEVSICTHRPGDSLISQLAEWLHVPMDNIGWAGARDACEDMFYIAGPVAYQGVSYDTITVLVDSGDLTFDLSFYKHNSDEIPTVVGTLGAKLLFPSTKPAGADTKKACTPPRKASFAKKRKTRNTK